MWCRMDMRDGGQSGGKERDEMDTPDTEIELFGYEDNSMAEHDRFQEWRKANWHGGFMLILSGAEGRPLMHKADCAYFGDADHRVRNIASNAKACSTNRGVLSKYAMRELGQMARACQHCL